MQHLPSNIDFLGEDEGTHDSHNDHHEGAEGRGEDWAPNLDHQPLHVVGDARRHYALCTHTQRFLISVVSHVWMVSFMVRVEQSSKISYIEKKIRSIEQCLRD
jgi:hypothetical protein